MKIHIIGLGASLNETIKYVGGTTIGVNDVYSSFRTDYVVCVDKPQRFEALRRLTIADCKPEIFYSNCLEWSFKKEFQHLKIAPIRSNLSTLDDINNVPYSNNSTFVACIMAYHLGATEIIMHGVDFKNHKQLSEPDTLERALKDFQNLFIEFNKRKIKLFINSNYSELSKIIPVYEFRTTDNNF